MLHRTPAHRLHTAGLLPAALEQQPPHTGPPSIPTTTVHQFVLEELWLLLGAEASMIASNAPKMSFLQTAQVHTACSYMFAQHISKQPP